MLARSSHNVSFLFPKNFKTFVLFESSNKVVNEDIVYNIPTYFSEIMLDKEVEFTYADNAICKEKRNDRTYILLIVFIFM